jgi:CheY-like chemotaxis protein
MSQKPLILVVENDAKQRATVCRTLARDSNVLAAENGPHAVELARKYRPDAIVSDLLQGVRTDPELHRIPLLVLTAFAGVEARVSALDAGADDCLSRPFHDDELCARVRSLIRARRRTSGTELPSAWTFRREGDFWMLSWGGEITRVKHSKGAHYLARLLERPHVEIHSLDLCAEVPESTPPPKAPPGSRIGALGDAGCVLDARAKQAYRERLSELREELQEANDFGDIGRSERARDEIDAITSEIASAVGLGGRDRKAASAAERARINVTRTIKSVVDRVSAWHRDLGAHLARSVRTGTYCSYSPAPGVPAEWTVQY